jgi:hypothetical protein
MGDRNAYENFGCSAIADGLVLIRSLKDRVEPQCSLTMKYNLIYPCGFKCKLEFTKVAMGCLRERQYILNVVYAFSVEGCERCSCKTLQRFENVFLLLNLNSRTSTTRDASVSVKK